MGAESWGRALGPLTEASSGHTCEGRSPWGAEGALSSLGAGGFIPGHQVCPSGVLPGGLEADRGVGEQGPDARPPAPRAAATAHTARSPCGSVTVSSTRQGIKFIPSGI